jgi:hypothetical protein
VEPSESNESCFIATDKPVVSSLSPTLHSSIAVIETEEAPNINKSGSSTSSSEAASQNISPSELHYPRLSKEIADDMFKYLQRKPEITPTGSRQQHMRDYYQKSLRKGSHDKVEVHSDLY